MRQHLAVWSVACLILSGCASVLQPATGRARQALYDYGGQFRHMESYQSILEFPSWTTTFYGEAKRSPEAGLCVAELMRVRYTLTQPNRARVDAVELGSLYGIVGDLTQRLETDPAANAREETACRKIDDTRTFFTVDGAPWFASRGAKAFVAVIQPGLCDGAVACSSATKSAIETLAREGLSHARPCRPANDDCIELLSHEEEPLVYASVTVWGSLTRYAVVVRRAEGEQVMEIE